MKKLLHERLRECLGTFSILETMGLDPDDDYTYEELFQLIADEIERYYIPRPRDNKGIPFVEEETVWSTDSETEYSAEVLSVFPNGIQVRWEDGFVDWRDGIELQHERPQPKVYDADGIEIKVGDTVWHTNGTGAPWTVEDVQECGIGLMDSDGIGDFRPPFRLTHKEPDSLERIKDDQGLEPLDYYRKYPEETHGKTKTGHLLERAIALIERGA